MMNKKEMLERSLLYQLSLKYNEDTTSDPQEYVIEQLILRLQLERQKERKEKVEQELSKIFNNNDE